MDTRDTPPGLSARPLVAPNAYEAFWECLEDDAPVAAATPAGDPRDAYRQFWDLAD